MAVRLLLLERVSGARFGATRTGLCLGKVSITLLFNWQEGVDMQCVFSFMLRLIVLRMRTVMRLGDFEGWFKGPWGPTLACCRLITSSRHGLVSMGAAFSAHSMRADQCDEKQGQALSSAVSKLPINLQPGEKLFQMHACTASKSTTAHVGVQSGVHFDRTTNAIRDSFREKPRPQTKPP